MTRQLVLGRMTLDQMRRETVRLPRVTLEKAATIPPPPIACKCGLVHDMQDWMAALRKPWPDLPLEQADCPCGSSLNVPVGTISVRQR